MSTKVKTEGKNDGVSADKGVKPSEDLDKLKQEKDENLIDEEEEKSDEDQDEEEDANQEEEEEDEEIIDLDDYGNEDQDLNKRNSQKDVNTLEVPTLKENLNTQITGTLADNRIETTERKTTGPQWLQNLDMNTVPKEEIVNFLLTNTEIFGSCSSADFEVMPASPFKSARKKRNHKYKNVESSFKQTKQRPNYLLSNSMEAGTAEKTYDFRTAVNRVAKQVAEGKIDKSLRLLVTKKAIEKTKHLEATNRDHIATKVDFYLNKKTKKIENIKDKLDEDALKGCTFRPVTNNPVSAETKRPLEEFLHHQANHLKKVQEHVKGMKQTSENKQVEDVKPPQIDKKSAKIFAQKIKTDDPTFLRLYRTHFEFKRKKEQKKEKKEKQRTSETDERIDKLYKDEFVKQQKFKEMGEKFEKMEMGEVDSLVSSNKLVLKKFKQQYYGEVSNLDKGSEGAQTNKLNLMQFYTLFLKLKFISKEFEKYFLNSSLEGSPNNNNDLLLNLNESKLKFTEKKLVQEIYENLKDDQGLVNKDDLYLFLLSVVNLYNYHSIKQNRKNIKESEILSSILGREVKEDEPNYKTLLKENKKEIEKLVLKRLDEDAQAQIKSQRKYVGLTEDNKIVITKSMSDNIHKDFNFLSINNSNANHINPKKAKKQANNLTFKPSTNPNSDKLCSNFRRKIQIDVSEGNMELSDKLKSNESTKSKQNTIEFESTGDNKYNITYIKHLLIKKKKREKLMAKKREENESKELVECSFHPKLISEYPSDQVRQDRFENLYKMGKDVLANRTDKKKEEVEREKNEKECTHKPEIKKELPDFSQTSTSFEDKSYHLYFERVKKGRHEKLQKEMVHSREPMLTLEEIEGHEEKSRQDRKEKREKRQNSQEASRSLEKTTTSNKPPKEKKVEGEGVGINLKAFNKKKDDDEKKEEKKEVIPLLIIDVNLRPGEKKKIYVFDGDTAEGLAEKFSKEHNLDNDTKNKLKVLIQSHMSKLLMRIEEENQSINSEKSSSNIFQ